MSGWLIALTGCAYLYVSLEQFFKGNQAEFGATVVPGSIRPIQ